MLNQISRAIRAKLSKTLTKTAKENLSTLSKSFMTNYYFIYRCKVNGIDNVFVEHIA